MLRTEELASARAELEKTLTDSCDVVLEATGWDSPAETVLLEDVPVRLAPRSTPALTAEGDRIDPNSSADAYLPVSTALEAGNVLRFPDGSRYRVVGIYPRPDAFRFLLKAAVSWA